MEKKLQIGRDQKCERIAEWEKTECHNNDMAGSDEDSWLSQFNASGAFESVDCQIAGLGEVPSIQELYVAHTKAAIDSLNG